METEEHEFDMNPLETCDPWECPECRRQRHADWDEREDRYEDDRWDL